MLAELQKMTTLVTRAGQGDRFLWPSKTPDRVMHTLANNVAYCQSIASYQEFEFDIKQVTKGTTCVIKISHDEPVDFHYRTIPANILVLNYTEWTRRITKWDFRSLRLFLGNSQPHLYVVGKFDGERFVCYHVATEDRVVYSPAVLRQWLTDDSKFVIPEIIGATTLMASPLDDVNSKISDKAKSWPRGSLIFYPRHAIEDAPRAVCERARFELLGTTYSH